MERVCEKHTHEVNVIVLTFKVIHSIVKAIHIRIDFCEVVLKSFA